MTKDQVLQTASDVAHNPKVGWGAAVAGGSLPLAEWMEWLPEGAEFASWAAGCLSIVLIVMHIRKDRRDRKLWELKMKNHSVSEEPNMTKQ